MNVVPAVVSWNLATATPHPQMKLSITTERDPLTSHGGWGEEQITVMAKSGEVLATLLSDANPGCWTTRDGRSFENHSLLLNITPDQAAAFAESSPDKELSLVIWDHGHAADLLQVSALNVYN